MAGWTCPDKNKIIWDGDLHAKNQATKEYVDSLTTDHPHQDVTTSAMPLFDASIGITDLFGNICHFIPFGAQTADRNLSINVNNADRILSLSSNVSLNQDLLTTSSPTFTQLTAPTIITSNLFGTGDPDTGIIFSTNSFFFQAGGANMLNINNAREVEVIVNDSQADVDFRVESDTADNLFFCDASTDNVGVGTKTPTTKFSVMEKSGMTPIGGFAIKLTNKTGGNTVAGQLVAVYTTTGIDDAFVTCSASDDNVIGIVLDAGVSDGSEAWVVVSGIADVLMDAGGSARGDRIISSTTAGSGDVWNTGGAVATHFLEIGHCIENRTGAGLARCVLHFN